MKIKEKWWKIRKSLGESFMKVGNRVRGTGDGPWHKGWDTDIVIAEFRPPESREVYEKRAETTKKALSGELYDTYEPENPGGNWDPAPKWTKEQIDQHNDLFKSSPHVQRGWTFYHRRTTGNHQMTLKPGLMITFLRGTFHTKNREMAMLIRQTEEYRRNVIVEVTAADLPRVVKRLKLDGRDVCHDHKLPFK